MKFLANKMNTLESNIQVELRKQAKLLSNKIDIYRSTHRCLYQTCDILTSIELDLMKIQYFSLGIQPTLDEPIFEHPSSNLFTSVHMIHEYSKYYANFEVEIHNLKTLMNQYSIKLNELEIRIDTCIEEVKTYELVKRRYKEIAKLYRSIFNIQTPWCIFYESYIYAMGSKRNEKRRRDSPSPYQKPMKEFLERIPILFGYSIEDVFNTPVFKRTFRHRKTQEWEDDSD